MVGPDADASDPSATHTFEGIKGAKIGCRLQLPEGPVRAVVVLLHGYDDPPTLGESIRRCSSAPGCAVFAMRMRGFAGSRYGVGSLDASELGWITHGLVEPPEDGGQPSNWVLSHAVADVLLGVRAVRLLLGEDLPVYLRGESFGGGLAVIAAARSGAMLCQNDDERIDRISVGLPTFGDWRWRLDRIDPRSVSVGGELKRFLLAAGEDAEGMKRMLDLFDASLHASQVSCPALVKLALRDDSVPAPTQAAIYNALGTPPGLKQRFITRYGHFDGGLADLRRHALFERISADFLDPDREPMDVLAQYEDVMISGSSAPGAAV